MERTDGERLAVIEAIAARMEKKLTELEETLTTHIASVEGRIARLENRWAYASGAGAAIGVVTTLAIKALIK